MKRLVASLALLACLGVSARPAAAPAATRYLTFQIFTGSFSSGELRSAFPPLRGRLLDTVRELRARIGTEAAPGRQIGVILGPLAFDDTDAQVREAIAAGFQVALETGVAVGYHIDDSMFWGRLRELNTHADIEWRDWKGTPNTGRRLDWSAKPLKIQPQLCLNSAAVRKAVTARAALIGSEVVKGLAKLHAARRDALFAGVIAGWETQLGRDFDSGDYLGYCALTNEGYSAAHPPADLDAARVEIVRAFIALWARSLNAAGVPQGKVYSHIAFTSQTAYELGRRANVGNATSYLAASNFTPPASAFCAGCVAGFSTYPQPGALEQWEAELRRRGNPGWASSEGTAVDPGAIGRPGAGLGMEGYLGNLFSHGALLVNLFGWGVGAADNPFRWIAESDASLAAYRKFVSGAPLAEAPVPVPNLPPAGLEAKIHKVQALLPDWIATHGPAEVRDDAAKLESALRAQRFQEASEAADALLRTIDADGR